jgi:hypothetical protein
LNLLHRNENLDWPILCLQVAHQNLHFLLLSLSLLLIYRVRSSNLPGWPCNGRIFESSFIKLWKTNGTKSRQKRESRASSRF